MKMELNLLKPRAALNKAFLKIKPYRSDIENFKKNLVSLLDGIDTSQSEEFHKNNLSVFLQDTWYKDTHFINTKDRSDLVIHNGKDAKSPVGVIIETKKPGNKTEMPRTGNINFKAFQELVLYYLRERINLKNLEIRYLIATDIYEWFIFDAQVFDRLFVQNKKFVKQFVDFEERRLADTGTEFFYKNIAEPFINSLDAELPFTWFNIRELEKPLRNTDRQDDHKLIDLCKLLSPEHLLKLPFANDSNTLDKAFYTELLHIIGLEETKEGGKKLIRRKKEESRNPGSLIESAITQLESLDKISRLKNAQRFGSTNQERLFNIALELSITWINRILFLKLLEAQLLNYNKGDKSYSFLNLERVKNFDDLDSLFFQVLARKPEERSGPVKKSFAKVPYLNSSLFDPAEIEHEGLFISQIKDVQLPVLSSTVLKDTTGRKRIGALSTLEYLFEFLNAYDFAGEGAAEIREDGKTLINASVLGLIFEKINGYKDGSFFTPGFITMYMCRETIRRAVVQKFNEEKKWHCRNVNDLYDKIEDKKEANEIVNSLKICDPAVGSGHFLVSALNEIIAVKNDLKILFDRDGRRLKEYSVEVVNDELIVTDEDGNICEYHPAGKESRRVQEALFHEKQTIIENCLFGVDINPNSVKICRLRLWIELLKNAYYKAPAFTELETLPNIDINIKCGNSLISRYQLDADVKEALRRSKWTIDGYRLAVMAYRNARSKDEKRKMEKLIEEIKGNFESEVAAGDKRIVRLKNLQDELKTHATQTHMFELTKTEKAAWEAKLKKLSAGIGKLEAELAEIRNNKIFDNAFEWRFEFPEVLNDEGDFVGFDVVIGNPPYGVNFNSSEKQFYNSDYFAVDDIYTLFIEKGINTANKIGTVSFITPIFWLTGDKYFATRKFIAEYSHIETGITLPYDIFADAYIDTGIYIFSKRKQATASYVYEFSPKDIIDSNILHSLNLIEMKNTDWCNTEDLKIIFNPLTRTLLNKFLKFDTKIIDIAESIRGILADQSDYSSYKINKEYEPVFVGKIDRYYSDESLQFVNYGENLKEKPASFKFFQGERLLIRRIISRQFRIMATIATDDFVTKKDIYTVKSKITNFSNKYLLAILNSKLISFIKTKESMTAKKDDFTQLTLKDIRELRLPTPTIQTKQTLETFVDQIVAAKKQDPTSDNSVLEKEIDQLVYQLYGLTAEEIRIVEQN
ncbi:MAG: type II restriction endonuclease [Deltaproteobacteria bacterium HGW-Deltaproteobacteria-12]|nr:MAG: type II restriction endonuclease [Deltaproteobacteria bacterium HGW-Deltaproteobacteria-12]